VSVAGLILAAGESSRMGSPKALLDFRGETFLDHLIGLFSEFCAPVVVVVGCEAERIRSGVRRPERALFAENKDYRLGQLSSMQCGLRMIPQTAEGVLFTLVDHPNVQPSTIAELLQPATDNRQPITAIAVPRFHGRRGHPMFFTAGLIPEFLDLPPDSQAKQVVNRNSGSIRYVDVDDPGILDDVDDPAAYSRLIETR
jgi:molybdenum cofactor cytidylyltransferase